MGDVDCIVRLSSLAGGGRTLHYKILPLYRRCPNLRRAYARAREPRPYTLPGSSCRPSLPLYPPHRLLDRRLPKPCQFRRPEDFAQVLDDLGSGDGLFFWLF